MEARSPRLKLKQLPASVRTERKWRQKGTGPPTMGSCTDSSSSLSSFLFVAVSFLLMLLQSMSLKVQRGDIDSLSEK